MNSEPQLPFCDVKASGQAASHAFTDLRLITVQTEPQSFPVREPSGRLKTMIASALDNPLNIWSKVWN